MIARVRGVIARSRSRGSRLQVSGSTSTSTGFAPRSTIISTVATKVNGQVITSSPGLMSSAISAMRSASVPLAQTTACFAPTWVARRCSSSATSGPRMYWPWSRTFWMRASIESWSARYWVLRSMKSMGNPAGRSQQNL